MPDTDNIIQGSESTPPQQVAAIVMDPHHLARATYDAAARGAMYGAVCGALAMGLVVALVDVAAAFIRVIKKAKQGGQS